MTMLICEGRCNGLGIVAELDAQVYTAKGSQARTSIIPPIGDVSLWCRQRTLRYTPHIDTPRCDFVVCGVCGVERRFGNT